jgi:hypothetical protein
LRDLILDENELSIARHEAILTYGNIFGKDKLITDMMNDKCRLVSESAEIID